MRYIHYNADGRRFSTDTELGLTHIVLGQRDEAPEREKLPPQEQVVRTPAEHAAVRKFVFDSTHGWYAMKALAWAASEEEANRLAEQFRGSGWVNVDVREINQTWTLTHA